MPFSSAKFYIFLKPGTSREPFSVQQLIINFFPPTKVDYPDINKLTFFLKGTIHFTTLPAMQQPGTKQQLATICQDVFLWRKEEFVGGSGKPALCLWKRELFQAQLLDTDTAETMTVLEQSNQGEVSIYSISGQQHTGRMRPSRSQLRIYKLNKRMSY